MFDFLTGGGGSPSYGSYDPTFFNKTLDAQGAMTKAATGAGYGNLAGEGNAAFAGGLNKLGANIGTNTGSRERMGSSWDQIAKAAQMQQGLSQNLTQGRFDALSKVALPMMQGVDAQNAQKYSAAQQSRSSGLGTLGGLAGAGLGFFAGGPMGAAAGYKIGSGIGGSV